MQPGSSYDCPSAFLRLREPESRAYVRTFVRTLTHNRTDCQTKGRMVTGPCLLEKEASGVLVFAPPLLRLIAKTRFRISKVCGASLCQVGFHDFNRIANVVHVTERIAAVCIAHQAQKFT